MAARQLKPMSADTRGYFVNYVTVKHLDWSTKMRLPHSLLWSG
jgi:hypothetical protein